MASKPQPHFPATRMRRNRRTGWSRRLVQEHTLTASDLIWPIFVRDGVGERTPVAAMPGVDRVTVDIAVEEVARAASLGIPAVAIFPYTDPALRDHTGSEALNAGNLTCRACRAIKDNSLRRFGLRRLGVVRGRGCRSRRGGG